MSLLNIDSVKDRTFDAIVVGSGISGGWSAKELTGKGLRTLLLERGRDVRHVTDYPTTMMQPWEFEHLGQIPKAMRDANPIASRCYAFNEDAAHFFWSKTRSIRTSRKNPSTGFGATRLAVNR